MDWIEQWRTPLMWLTGILAGGGITGAAFGDQISAWLNKPKPITGSVKTPSSSDARDELMAILVRGQVICRDVLKDQTAVDHLAAVQASLMKVPEPVLATMNSGFSNPQG